MLRVLIVDDEAPARNRLIRKLGPYKDLIPVGEATNGREALEKIAELGPDVVFLDIDMPELDGFGVARSLGNSGPALVFVTAYDEFALKAFETSAVDYLVKPVADDRLKKTVERLRLMKEKAAPDLSRLLETLVPAPRRVALRSGSKYVVVNPAEVSALIARDHYVAVLVEGREFLLEESLESVAEKFRGVDFLRVHRGAMLNLLFLQELIHEGDRKYVAALKDSAKTRVPISRERLPDVKRALGLL